MDWFFSWWNGLTLVQQIFACAALPASILLILQTILLLFGMGGHAADHGEIDDHSALFQEPSGDVSAGESPDAGEVPQGDMALEDGGGGADQTDPSANHDLSHQGAGVRLLTIRGLVAFFAVGGWLGIVMVDVGAAAWLATLIAFLGGLAALVLVAFILKWALSLQESGNLSIRNAVAQTGTVYLTIPPSRSGRGKVSVTVQEQLTELDAVTDHPTSIPTGSQIQVTGIAGNTLIVRPLSPVKTE